MKKWRQRGAALTAAALTLLAGVCVAARLPALAAQDAALTAAGFILPGGAAQAVKNGFPPEEDAEDFVSAPPESEMPQSSAPSSSLPESSVGGASSQGESSAPASSAASNSKYQEVVIPNTGTSLGNVWVMNTNKNHSIDIDAELKKEPAVKIKKDGTPQVLIYHTHTTEAYQGVTRTQDNSKNVVSVGDRIAEELEKAGIGVVHDATCHDYPSYNGSYSRSLETMKKNLEKYPGIQVTLDIHRDAIGSKKPTVTVNGKKAAQVMIVSGCDDLGKLGFPDWEYNLRFGLRLQKALADNYTGLPRPLKFSNVRYNEHLTKGSLLIEVGTDGSTLEEAQYSGELLGRALAGILNGLT